MFEWIQGVPHLSFTLPPPLRLSNIDLIDMKGQFVGRRPDPGCKVTVIRSIIKTSQNVLSLSWSSFKVAAQNNDTKIESIPG